jgi:parallel beta-helix repeat protein
MILDEAGRFNRSGHKGLDLTLQILSILALIFIGVIIQNFVSISTGINPFIDGDETYSNTSVSFTVTTDEEQYYAKTKDGLTVAQSTEFGQMMNNLNRILTAGDVILIKRGVYTLSERYWNQDKDKITIKGESRDDTIIRSSPTLNETPFMIADPNGGMHPAHCIVENITFDSNFNPNYFELVLFGGQYNIIRNCNFLNAVQYSLVAFRAHDFKILNNYVATAQYGITTAAPNGQEWSSNGIISGNVVKDCRDCGFKIKWTKDTIIENNTIDVTYHTWIKNGQNNSYNNCIGISLYHADGPTQNITVSHNIINDSSSIPGETVGVGIDNDDLKNQGLSSSVSTGSKIIGNRIYGCNFGVFSQLPNVLIEQNTIANIKQGLPLGGIGIYLRNSSASQVMNNTLIRSGISISGSSDGCVVSNNKISGGITYWRLDGDGIGIWNDDITTHTDNCIIDSNIITNCRRYGIHIYTASDIGNPVSGTIIKNNTVKDCAMGAILDEGINTHYGER